MENIQEHLCKLYVACRQRYVLTLPGGKFFTPKKSNGEYCKLTNNVLLNH